MLKISICKEIDKSNLLNFIYNYWRKDHILCQSNDLFDWQYKNTDGTYNFIIAKSNKEIIGILGFIETKRYDKAISNLSTIWLALWKVKSNCKIPAVGLKLLIYLKKNYHNRAIAVIGINEVARKVYNSLGYKILELSHYYTTRKDYKKNILDNNFTKHPNPSSIGQLLEEIDLENISKLTNFFERRKDNLFGKTLTYFKNKYLNHPFYKYKLYFVHTKYNKHSLLSTRIDKMSKTNVLRIVDHIGDEEALAEIGYGINYLIEKYNCEFVDFWNFGIKKDYLKKAGFDTPETGVIVPSYFEPFVYKNIRLFSAISNTIVNDEKIFIYKADGDQDRPNCL